MKFFLFLTEGKKEKKEGGRKDHTPHLSGGFTGVHCAIISTFLGL